MYILISVFMFAVYVTAVTIKYGWLPSISHSVYKHKESWLFFAFMSGIGLPICFMALEETSYFLLLSGILFILCGASPYFHSKTAAGEPNKFESTLHSIGAEGGIIAALIHLALHGEWWWSVAMLIPSFIMMRTNMKNHTYWIEVMAFVFVGLGLAF